MPTLRTTTTPDFADLPPGIGFAEPLLIAIGRLAAFTAAGLLRAEATLAAGLRGKFFDLAERFTAVPRATLLPADLRIGTLLEAAFFGVAFLAGFFTAMALRACAGFAVGRFAADLRFCETFAERFFAGNLRAATALVVVFFEAAFPGEDLFAAGFLAAAFRTGIDFVFPFFAFFVDLVAILIFLPLLRSSGRMHLPVASNSYAHGARENDNVV